MVQYCGIVGIYLRRSGAACRDYGLMMPFLEGVVFDGWGFQMATARLWPFKLNTLVLKLVFGQPYA